MTGGSNNGGPTQGGSQPGGHVARGVASTLPPRDDREALSALLDGELPPDAARFAVKRLSHDAQWRETCGRWQLIGDALRGEAVALAPADFAAGVARALGAVEVAGAAATAAPLQVQSSARLRGRWLGGAALAASVVLAAVLVARPSSTGVATPVAPAVATLPASPQLAPVQPPAAPAAPVVAGGDAVAAATTAAPADQPRKARSARMARVVAQRPASPDATEPVAVDLPAAAVADQDVAAPGLGPFQPRVDAIATRPWPRAVLPEASAAGAFTVGLEDTSSAPGFYPFEPQAATDDTQDSSVPLP